MRTEILNYIAANPVSGFTASNELPYDKDSTPLFLSNFKKIYVDLDQTTQEPLIETLDNNGIVNEITSVTTYVVTDAKTLPTNYDILVSTLKSARLTELTSGWTQRSTQVDTRFEGDALVTEFKFNFNKLIFNN